jgi:hypothetical protein
MKLDINYFKSLIIVPETPFEREYLDRVYKHNSSLTARYYEDGQTPILIIETDQTKSEDPQVKL